MTNNYKAWLLSPNQFPTAESTTQQVKFILKFGILAPSGHNSQPWNFKIHDNTVKIFINQQRSLVKSDPSGKQLFIALGCFTENIVIAADYFGFSCDVTLTESATEPLSLIFAQRNRFEPRPNHLIHAIPLRHTDRGNYTNTEISVSMFEQFKSLANEEVDLFIITNKILELKQKICDLMINAQIDAMESKDFRGELSEFVKNSYTKQKYGMTGVTLNIPGLISLLAPKLIKYVNVSKITKKQDEKNLKNHTPAIGIITTAQNDKMSWFKAGKIFESSWLFATKHGVAFSPLAAVSQNKIFSAKLQDLIKTSKYPAILFRIGYPIATKIKHSPRFDLNDLILSEYDF